MGDAAEDLAAEVFTIAFERRRSYDLGRLDRPPTHPKRPRMEDAYDRHIAADGRVYAPSDSDAPALEDEPTYPSAASLRRSPPMPPEPGSG